MTTIAYRDGVIASDSRTTIKDVIDNDTTKKLFKLSDGSVIGMSGDWVAGILLLDEMKKALKTKEKKLPTGRFKCNALLACPNGDAYFFERGFWCHLDDWDYDYYAIGSGFVPAMTAMDMNGTAREAVAAGIKRDIYSGGKIQSYKVF